MTRTLLILLMALALLLGGCSGSTDPKSSQKHPSKYPYKIVATTGMVADLAKRVGGDKVQVEVLMGPGVDPHLYKASPGDISKINGADVVLYSGLHLEGKMGDVFEKVAERKPVLAVTEHIAKNRLLNTTQGVHDPHLWFDVELWSNAIDPLAEFLMEYDPSNAETYKTNAAAYKEELQKLHEEVKSALVLIPKERRVLITAHDAFQYFGRAYDVEVRGIQGISTESEAGLQEINKLVDLIVTRKIKAVFVETSVSEKNIQALIEGARRRGASVRIGGSLYSDAMGAPGTPEGEYPGMVRKNVSQIVGALK